LEGGEARFSRHEREPGQGLLRTDEPGGSTAGGPAPATYWPWAASGRHRGHVVSCTGKQDVETAIVSFQRQARDSIGCLVSRYGPAARIRASYLCERMRICPRTVSVPRFWGGGSWGSRVSSPPNGSSLLHPCFSCGSLGAWLGSLRLLSAFPLSRLFQPQPSV